MLYFTREELTFLAEYFGYKNLQAADFVEYNQNECIDSLVKKEYITPYGSNFKLSNECRLLLSAWQKIRYTLVKDSSLSDDYVYAILAGSQSVISYVLHYNDIEVSMCDFSIEIMDKIIADYLKIIESNNCKLGFNITLTAEEYVYCFGEETPSALICKKTGLSIDDVDLIKRCLKNQDNTPFIVQDLKENVGCRGILFKYPNEYVLIKHIVPNNNPDMQKVVIVKGNSVDVVDSIYIV